MTTHRTSTTDGLSRAAVVVMVAATEESYQTARLLIGALGAVQVEVVHSGEVIPANSSVIILLDDRATVDGADAHRIWRLADAPHAIGSRHMLEVRPRSDRSGTAPLYTDLVHHLIVTNNASASPLENASNLTWYYAGKRLRKSVTLTEAERAEFNAAIALLDSEPDGDQLLRRLLPGSCEMAADSTTQSRCENPHMGDVDAEPRNPESIFLRAATMTAIEVRERETLIARLEHWLPRVTRARELAWIAGAAHLLRAPDVFGAAVERMLCEELFDSATGCIRSEPKSDGFCYSPLLAAVLLIARRGIEPNWRPDSETSHREPIAHRLFEPSTNDPLRGCMNRTTRTISRTLFTAWRQLHSVPNTNNRQYELREENYLRSAADIEAVWLTILRTLILEAGQPFVRLIPWPHKASFAFSLRYDIDRPTTPQQVERIIDLQRVRLGVMCGSWYGFADNAHLIPIQEMLSQHGQEIGRHAVRANESLRGLGVTFHSAPSSSYWRGSDTISTLESGGARYAEMLAAQLGTPRSGWLASSTGGRPTKLPLTPLHFPLEGSTSDDSLAYFDRLVPAFHRQRERGGHLIVGSHPDLNQDILAELLDREHLDDGWCAPIGEVVDRCVHVLGYDRIRLVQPADAVTPALLSDDDIDALQVLIDDGERVATEVVSLNAGIPTFISPAPLKRQRGTSTL